MTQLGKQFERMGAQIDRTLNRQGLLSATQRNAFVASCKGKAKKEEWEKARVHAELQIHEMMPHYGLFIEEQYFENDEGNYQPIRKYALFHVKERISPWYWEVWTLRSWARQQKRIIMSYLQLQAQLHSHRVPSEKSMRPIHD